MATAKRKPTPAATEEDAQDLLPLDQSQPNMLPGQELLAPASDDNWMPNEAPFPKYVLAKKLPRQYKKANSLIHNKPHSVLSATQRKIINVLTLNAQVNMSLSETHGYWKLRIKDLKQELDSNSNNQAHLEKIINEITSIRVIYNALETEGVSKNFTIVFPHVKILNGEIIYQIHHEVLQLIANSKSYTQLLNSEVRPLKKTCSIPLFEYGSRYLRLGYSPWKSWEDLRNEILSTTVIPKNAETWTKFNKFYIAPALEEINTLTPLSIELEKNTKGNAVQSVRVKVFRAASPLNTPPAKQDKTAEQDLIKQLLDVGFTERSAKKLFSADSGFTPQEIEAALIHTKWRMENTKLEKLEVPARFLRRSLNDALYVSYIERGIIQVPYSVLEKLNKATNRNSNQTAGSSGATSDGQKTVKRGKEKLIKLVMTKRLADVKAIVNEMPKSELYEIFDKYNEQVSIKALVMKHESKNRVSNLSLFYTWYSNYLWGEVDDQAIVAHLASMEMSDSLFK